MPSPAFRERLSVPASWWAVLAVFVVSVFVAGAFSLGPAAAALMTVLFTAVALAVVLSYGGTRIVVDDEALQVGDSRIEWRWVGGVRHLDPEATQRRLRTEADARAHLEMRSYIREAVEVTIDDPADPHPYWLVSSRRAEHLAAQIGARLQERTDVS
ncbi:hypothetical protein GCM10027418_10670 [Mariniluteicoccus endophyticus]